MDTRKKICCLTPVYNDWDSFGILLSRIKDLQDRYSDQFTFFVVAVNDGSSEENPGLPNSGIAHSIINLKVNIGHQRAIAVGLQYVFNEVDNYHYVVVMDSDGEDRPEDLPTLIEKAEATQSRKIIFARRRKRQESALFKTGYFFYRWMFYFLTGQKISFGNFSIIPKGLLGKVVHQGNIWNHYSGGIIQSRTPYDSVPTDRGKRYSGSSKMNFNGLIIHGLSSIAVYFDFLSLRILRFSLYGIAICTASVTYILYQKLFTDNAIPGWASSLILIITGIILQLFSVTLIVLLLQLSSRKNIQVPNAKIYKEFIESYESH